MNRVWQIPELLCQIISHLPAEDILRPFEISHRFRTILKANLAPQLRALPDGPFPRNSSSSRHLPQSVRDKAKQYLEREIATPKQVKYEDAYYEWREYAHCQILYALVPYLHPVLGEHTRYLTDGFESLAKGGMNISVQINIQHQEHHSLIHGKSTKDRYEFLAVVPPKSVTVFCIRGMRWDLLYADVRYTLQGGMKRFFIRVERERGVRLGDVLDALKGTLIVDEMRGGSGQDVMFVWVFDDDSDG